MKADELTSLVQQRFEALMELLDMGQLQITAINENRMTDLMRILSDKQPAIARLTEIARQLATAVDDDPEQRRWSSDAARQHCRTMQQQCELMHQELLAIEADCETRLTETRDSVQEKLTRFESGRVAANSYARSQTIDQSGGSLDLSSD
ncbi:FlgN protein [Rubripirellula lacrimiformis]|uniref:FlgN protein n=1 Tax=Rubripirellula lacrimiformis TaxID=1930273 RepID=A0A517N6G5_9BACT|nr:hypothetical protein [Rubripirellula lacrimiformis]QDT02734.1 FlgN protein [Rubripirellula lacrimiformis]